uniref:Conserved protein n=1 Tax=Strongyloides papillosus TaxID=174720 RepID=A0A0N5BZT8_STREA
MIELLPEYDSPVAAEDCSPSGVGVVNVFLQKYFSQKITMKLSSRIALLAIFVAIIMACLVTYGNAENATIINTTGRYNQNSTTTTSTTAKPTPTPEGEQSSAATGLSYSGSNSIILSAFCAISIILGAKL